jgi:hypothetical protein
MKILKLPDGSPVRMDDPPEHIMKIVRTLSPKVRKGGLPSDTEALDLAMLKDWLYEQHDKYGDIQ